MGTMMNEHCLLPVCVVYATSTLAGSQTGLAEFFLPAPDSMLCTYGVRRGKRDPPPHTASQGQRARPHDMAMTWPWTCLPHLQAWLW